MIPEAPPEESNQGDTQWFDDEYGWDDDEPLACGLENPEVCESCQ